MIKLITILLISITLLLISCAHNKTLIVDGKQTIAEPYGWANSDARKNDKVIYELSAGNICWSIILSETVVVPVYLTGWKLFQPVRVK